MNEENQTFPKVADVEAPKGQAMYIYLPEGAVIVDRTQVNVANSAPVEHVAPIVEPVQPKVQYLQDLPQEQPQVHYVQAQPAPTVMQPQVQYVQPQPQVQYVQPQVQYVQPQPQVQYAQTQPNLAFLQDSPSVNYRRERRRDHLVLRRRHRISWVHTLNVAFAAYIVAVTVIPFLLTAITGVSLYSSKTSVSGLTIERGELMITHATPVAKLIPGDIILLRDKNSWNLQVRQLVSTAANGRLTSVFTNSGVDGTVSDVTTIEGTANVHKVTSSIPVFGYFATFFGSILVKSLAAALIFYMNLRHMHLRRRRRQIDEKVVFVAKDPVVHQVVSEPIVRTVVTEPHLRTVVTTDPLNRTII